MSKKSAAIAAIIEKFQDRELNPNYLGYFECFNRELFFEAHDVLEELWLACRHGPNDAFYKGLIQLAGAFVHLQKGRLRPAAALFKLAQVNLEKYPVVHESLEAGRVAELAADWRKMLESGNFERNPFRAGSGPKLAPLP